MNECELIQYYQYGLGLTLLLGGFAYYRQYTKIQQLIKSEDDLLDEVYFDSLTKLPNRKNIDAILSDQVNRCQRHGKSFYIAQVKINNINDLFQKGSKEEANNMIIKASQQLFSAIRDEDMVGHVSRDNFTVIFNEYLDPANLEIIFKRVYDALYEEFELSIGISQFPNDAQNAELLVECSHKALSKVNENDRSHFHFYQQ
ncbi:MAG: GGDEF domain-containing protein [Campylobacterota bacterium]|nr:GGDEF domain-containing protein [Campylobacterota bacterium]